MGEFAARGTVEIWLVRCQTHHHLLGQFCACKNFNRSYPALRERASRHGEVMPQPLPGEAPVGVEPNLVQRRGGSTK